MCLLPCDFQLEYVPVEDYSSCCKQAERSGSRSMEPRCCIALAHGPAECVQDSIQCRGMAGIPFFSFCER